MYMPDVGAGVIDLLDDELRYLQRKKLIKELDSVRLKVYLLDPSSL
jgi:regulator of nonsense transcripts 2